MTRELEVLRSKYWPGRLLDWRVEHRSLPGFIGYCDYGGKRLLLDLDKPTHRSARQRRTTLLHECCHALRPNGAHDEGFFSEIERLLGMGEHALDSRDAGRYDPMALKPFPRCFRRWERCMRKELAREL
jgi:hypothetical protein